MKMVIFVQSAIIITLLALLGIFIYVDIWPSFSQKYFAKQYLNNNISDSAYVDLCYHQALNMMTDDDLEISIYDDNSFVERYRRWKYDNEKSSNEELDFYKNYLALGLLKYQAVFNKKNEFYINTIHKIKKYNHVTNTTSSWLALELYHKTNNKIYISEVHKGIDYLYSAMDADSLIHYWNNDLLLVDGLGMYIPFLVEYYKTFGDKNALNLAKVNFDYFIRYGTCNNLPHWFIKKNIGVGLNNWGRGISWYILGLLALGEVDEKYQAKAKLLADNLLKLQSKPFKWNQFIGIEANSTFDSTATIPILILLNKVYPQLIRDNIEIIMSNLKSITLEDGTVMSASGDSSKAPFLNRSKGCSEFSQGLLLWFFADYMSFKHY